MDLFEIPDDYRPEKPLTNQEAEEITEYLKGHPLFLKELPQDISQNEHLMALHSLDKEEDPEKTAQNLNKQGNERLKQGPNSPYYMKDAYGKYTQAINLKPKDVNLLAKLHCNRAMINLKYKNYGKVIEDCKTAIKHDLTYIKAYYRMAKALIALRKFQNCISLLKDQSDPDLQILLKEATELLEKEKAMEKKKQEKTVTKMTKIEQYCKDRNWKLGKKAVDLPEGVEIQFIEDRISIPLVIIYPEFNQFDLIAKTGEHQQLTQTLTELFSSPLPWDSKGQYSLDSIELFSEVEEGILLKVPRETCIEDVASRVQIRGAIEIVVVARNAFSQFYKKQYKIF